MNIKATMVLGFILEDGGVRLGAARSYRRRKYNSILLVKNINSALAAADNSRCGAFVNR